MKRGIRTILIGTGLLIAFLSTAGVRASESGTTLNGTIEPMLISVTLPAEVPFVLDTNKTVDVTTGQTQAISPTEAKIINGSALPVKISVTGAAVTDGPAGFCLAGRLSEVKAGSVFLALRKAGETFANEEALEAYALRVPAEGEALSIPVMKVEAEREETLCIYGKGATNAKLGVYGFHVETTLKVELVREEAPSE
ncbi:hypothetical protein [Anaerolentibacter hominis]|uniref:hypothetical protein n=1 Tax=Anaerolentibacter hominis TaxID=3079009 RepID=UPI0031B7F77E